MKPADCGDGAEGRGKGGVVGLMTRPHVLGAQRSRCALERGGRGGTLAGESNKTRVPAVCVQSCKAALAGQSRKESSDLAVSPGCWRKTAGTPASRQQNAAQSLHGRSSVAFEAGIEVGVRT